MFDVGHGSCILIRDQDVATVVDCRDAPLMIDHLQDLGVTTINQLIVTHADADHIGGIGALAQSDLIVVEAIYINADATKDTQVWQDLKMALQDAHTRKSVKVFGASVSYPLVGRELAIEFLAPGIAWQLSGSGGATPDGKAVDSNGMSVVLKILHEGHSVALLAADMNTGVMEDLVARGSDLKADVLIYPHHGGYVSSSGAAEKKEAELDAFSKEFLSRVQPELVLFSIGRGMHSTPRPVVIRRIREINKSCAIFCTQISKHCHDDPLPTTPSHLFDLPARGRPQNKCCGGSIEIQFQGKQTLSKLSIKPHSDFVNSFADKALCRQ